MQQHVRRLTGRFQVLRGVMTPLLLLVFGSLVLGGSPNRESWQILLLCLLAAFVLAMAVAHGAHRRFAGLPPVIRAAAFSIVLLPILQLIPLPPGLWQSLPGRELSQEVLSHIGASNNWRALSLTPSATFLGALMLLPSASVFMAVITLDCDQRRQIALLIVLTIAASVLVGLVQFGTGGTALDFYRTSHSGSLLGFFANRNHQGLLLAIGASLAVAIINNRLASGVASASVSGLVSLVFLIAAIGTLSRAGIGLTLVSILVTNYVFFAHGKLKLKFVAPFVLLSGVGLYFVSFSSTAQRAFERFSQVSENGRAEIWLDSLPMVTQVFPVGSGLGSFATIYSTIEKLEDVNPLFLNRAHNDYLETVIEFGAFAILALLLMLVSIASRVRHILRSSARPDSLVIAAIVGIGLVGLHSIVDYPLRTQAHLVIFGALCAVFFSDPASSEERASGQYWLVAGGGVGLASLLATGMVFYRETGERMIIRPEQEIIQAEGSAATATQKVQAERLLSVNPLDQRILNFIFVSRIRDGINRPEREAIADTLFKLGWRRTSAQQNLLFESIQNNDIVRALDHIDALLRRDKLKEQIFPLLGELETIPEGTPLLAERLAKMPNWRDDYFAYQDRLSNPKNADARLRLFSLMYNKGMPVNRAEIAPSLLSVLDLGRREQLADFVNTSLNVDTRTGLLFDPFFDQLASLEIDERNRPLPHDWRLTNRSGVTSQIRFEEGSGQLVIEWDGRGAPILARTMSFVRIGQQPTLRIRVDPGFAGPRSVVGLRFSLWCQSKALEVPLVESTPTNDDGYVKDLNTFEFISLTPSPCDYPDLNIGGQPSTADQNLELYIDSIELLENSIGD